MKIQARCHIVKICQGIGTKYIVIVGEGGLGGLKTPGASTPLSGDRLNRGSVHLVTRDNGHLCQI